MNLWQQGPTWFGWAALAFLVAAVVLIWFRWFEHTQVYAPKRKFETAPGDLGRAFEDVRFKTSDGMEINGWYFPPDPGSARAEWVFLVCHGNGGNISRCLGTCQVLLQTGAGAFVIDYRGYGRSPGVPSEEGTYLDAQAAFAWLRERGFAAENILLLGESLGGAVTTELALRERCGGLILVSTFTSLPDVGEEIFPWLPVRALGSTQYDTRNKLARVHVPLLILHSRTDRRVRFHHAEKNYAVANEPKLFRELRTGHYDPQHEEPEFAKAIEEFLKRVEIGQPKV